MPYNKGDFTQQGINGDVSALVRLNEKRVMKVVLSSDDESDNCDISGKVYDLLNGTSYDIGSGGGGGGDSILKCTITFINDSADEQYIDHYIGACEFISNNVIIANIDSVLPNESATYTGVYVKDGEQYLIGYNSENIELTNIVNCEVITTGDWEGYISPIDPTLDSSFTITAEGIGGGV